MRTRSDVWKLAAQDDTLLWYGRAVDAMQQLPKTNPLSWEYQAAIHGSVSVPSSLLRWWDQCQHSTSFFLPWHRMYVLHFERIVAMNVVKLGGPKDWALPYWNYSQNPTSLAMPPAFRNPKLANGLPNPLYVAARNPIANSGGAVLAAKDVDLKTCLTAAATTAPAGFFGDPPSAHFGTLAGSLELTPHNAVHRAVGAGGGWMADPYLAALDPIFWLHHANIDRLWEVWLTRDPQHSNLTTAYWLTGVTFSFHDASGASVSMRSADVLNLSDPAIDYSYEDTTDPLASRVVGFVATGAIVSATTMSNPPLELVGATLDSVHLDDRIQHAEWTYLESLARHYSLPRPTTSRIAFGTFLKALPAAYLFNHEFNAFLDWTDTACPPAIYYNLLLQYAITELCKISGLKLMTWYAPEAFPSDMPIPDTPLFDSAIKELMSCVLDGQMFYEAVLPPVSVLDPRIYVSVVSLEICAQNVVSFHEYGHLLLGHIERSHTPALEFEADVFALQLISKSGFPNREHAIASVFAIMNVLEMEYGVSTLHPSSVDRFTHVANAVGLGLDFKKFEHAANFYGELFDRFLKDRFGRRLFQASK